MKIELKPEYAADNFFARPPVNRTRFGPGPWEREPEDKTTWVDEASGYTCWAMRTELGNWCGYVILPASHPAEGAEMIGALLDEIQVHGGVTFSEAAGPGGAWVVGFDCAHGCDTIPAMELPKRRWEEDNRHTPSPYALGLYGTYRTLNYVQEECGLLAEQLRELADEEK